MAALTADRKTRMRAGGYTRTIIGKLAAATTIYKGAMCAKNAAGYIVPASDSAAIKIVGVAQSTVANAGAAGAAEVAMVTGVFEYDNDGVSPVVQADMHGPCYVSDDHTVRTAGGKCFAGLVDEIKNGKVWLKIEPELDLPASGSQVGTVSDTQTVGGVPVEYFFVFADAATADQDRILDHKFEVTDVVVQKRAGAGAAGNLVTVKNAATAISNDIDTNVADKVLARAGTIDDAQSTILAGGTLRVTNTKAGGNSASLVKVVGTRRA